LSPPKTLVTFDVLHQVSKHRVGGVENLHGDRTPVNIRPVEDVRFFPASNGVIEGVNGS
jgi:hypothetical protein